MSGVRVRFRNSMKRDDRHDVDDERWRASGERRARASQRTGGSSRYTSSRPTMNGRMLSRAIQNSRPTTMAAPMQDRDPRRERGEPRLVAAARPDRRTAAAAARRPRPRRGRGGRRPASRRTGRRRRSGRARPSSGRLPDVPDAIRPRVDRAAAQPPCRAAPALAARGRPAPRMRRADPARAGRGLGGRAGGRRSAARPGRGRAVAARISFGAPLPVGMAAEGELIDVVLTERWPAWRVREALEPVAARRLAARRRRTTCGWPGRRWPAASRPPTTGSRWPPTTASSPTSPRASGRGRRPARRPSARAPATQGRGRRDLRPPAAAHRRPGRG